MCPRRQGPALLCGPSTSPLEVIQRAFLRASSGAGTLEFMARALEEIREEIRALSTSDKEELLRSLWEELDGPPDPDVEAAWLEEIRRRDLELDQGQVESIPAEEVFQRLRSKLKK